MSALFQKSISFYRSPDFMISVRKAFYGRAVRKNCIVYSPIGIIGVLGLIAEVRNGKSGGAFWLLIFIGVIPYLLWMAHHASDGRGRFPDSDKPVVVTLESDLIKIVTGDESCEIDWSRIKYVQKARSLTILFWDGKIDLKHALALPKSALNTEQEQFIVQKLINHKVKTF
jgi:hypothetical protein